MTGSENPQANNPGGYDLLRRATQAMMSRTSSEDGGDQIGYDAPQSGAATPQPDLRDKRLPGIMSYFSQVRRDAPTPHAAETTSPSYFALKTPPAAYAEPFNWPTRRHMASRSADLQATAAPPTTTITNAIPTMMRAAPSSRPSSRPPSRPLSRAPSGANLNLNLNLNLAMTSGPAEEGSSDHLQAGQMSSSGRDPGLVRHSYFLTPPTSLPSSSVSSPVQERRNPFWSVGPAGAALRDTDIMPPPPVSSCSTPGLEKSSREDPIITTTPPDAHDGGDDGRLAGWNPWQGSKSKSMPNSTRNSTSAFRPQTPQPGKTEASGRWYTLEGLRELTRGLIKSGPPTPTRALSTAQPSPHAENHDLLGAGKGQGRSGSRSVSNDDGAEPSGTQTPRGGVIGTGPTAATSSASTGAQAPAPKGKLTIKIPEARGLRKSRDPYLIVVFQRSELISASPRSMDGGETLSPAPPTLGGGVPIQRQGSDNGPPPMSIPMRSRQSSNTSVTDHSNVRRPSRVSFTNPKWDAEAVFDVVDSDMAVGISVYDHTVSGEEFLGYVNFQASQESDEAVKGWFALEGHADTMAENAPMGEIYVEAHYQGSEKKHFGPSDFQILKLIGKGTFGQVYQVRKRDTKRIYAMKVLQKKVIVQKKEVAHTVGERNILVRTAMAESPFIVGLKFSFQTPSELYLVIDYMSGGELFWHLQKEGRFDEKRAKFYIAELILAIQHLHNNDIVYRDLKPENILLDANGHIALCDFGLSKANLTNNDTTNTFCGTTEYLAPEVLLDESGYTKMVDFWSLGVLVFEMCCGWSPFYAEDTQQMYKNIAFGKVRFPRDTLSQEGRNFVKGLLNRNPKHRLGATDDAEELKQHPFFADIDWTLLSKKLITPPFKPNLKSETDVSYFDPEFTTALEQNGSLNERAAALARGYAASTPLSPSVQANFQGFTFVDESALDDHMRDRLRMNNDDEDMDDARDARESATTGESGDHVNNDDDWDNLDDIDPRKANRMSGIMKGSPHDDQMVGGSHFDP